MNEKKNYCSSEGKCTANSEQELECRHANIKRYPNIGFICTNQIGGSCLDKKAVAESINKAANAEASDEA